MRKLTAADHAVMPWKNGGGTTTELAIAPAGAGLDDFDWRISSAAVRTAGPFSRFDGIDRTLAILDGAGLKLRIDGDTEVLLRPGTAPFAFAGERQIEAALLAGAVTDFNVMTRRGRWRHRLQRVELGTAPLALPSAADQLFIYCAAGSVVCRVQDTAGTRLAAGEALLADRSDTVLTLTADAGALLYLAHLTLEGNPDD